jgi:transposase-like protein
MYVKLRRKGKIENVAVYSVLGVDMEGHRDILGHWIGDGAEGANFWLSVITDLHNRGVEDIFIACVDGLSGFSDAIHSVFPQTQVQRCIVHQVRNSLKYVPWKERKAFAADLRRIYQAPTREQAETELLRLGEIWGDQYAIAVRSWENNWPELATMFDYTPEIRLDLHHQLGGELSQPAAQGGQDQELFSHARGRSQAALPGHRQRHPQMDRPDT